MTFYYAAHSNRSLEEVCNRLQTSLDLPAFSRWGEAPFIYTEPGDWSWASVSNGKFGLRLSRMERPAAADVWMPGQPADTNFHVALSTDREPPEFAVRLRAALGSPVQQYADVDSVWTVAAEAEHYYRRVRQTCCPGEVTIFTLRLSPTLDAFPCRFVAEVDYDAVERECYVEPEHARAYVHAVEAGVDACVQRWTMTGRPVGHLEVALTEIRIHLIDSSVRRFREGGARALEQVLEQHAIIL